MSSMPLGVVVRDTAPRFTFVVGVTVGGTNRSVRPCHGLASSLVADFGATCFSCAGIAGFGAVVGGGLFAGACANATPAMVQLHNNAAMILCVRIISCSRPSPAPPRSAAWPAPASTC
jgi:hypothetical protein